MSSVSTPNTLRSSSRYEQKKAAAAAGKVRGRGKENTSVSVTREA